MTSHRMRLYQASWIKRLITYNLIFILLTVASLSILALGMRSALRQDSLFYFVKNIKRLIVSPTATAERESQNYFGQLIAYPLKTNIPPPIVTDKTIVAFVFGQSNSANHEGERYKAINKNVINYFDGKYYVASDPLLGATGNGGSVWTITANKLLEENIADKVVLIPAGVGGSSVKHWRKEGKLNMLLEDRLKDAQNRFINITHFLWHQGEADYGVSESEYRKGLTEVIQLTQRYFPESKFFVAQASMCFDVPSYEPILKAQRDVTHLKNVYIGPNTDLIDDRYDGCHLSGRGVEKASNQWVERIKSPRKA